MGTLSQCIRRAGKSLDAKDAEEIRKLRNQLKAEGMTEAEAAKEAVAAQMNSTLDARDAILKNTAVDPDMLPTLRNYTEYEIGVTPPASMSFDEDTDSYQSQEATPDEVRTRASLSNAVSVASKSRYGNIRALKLKLQNDLTQGADYFDFQDNEYLVEMAVTDAKEALKDNANAVGWYDDTVGRAMKTLAVMHPEIQTDPDARFAFTYALAVTSNGLKVDANFKLAEQAYSYYKKNGTMPTDLKAGPAQGAINKTMELFNRLSAEWGLSDLGTFMNSRMTVGELTKRTGIKVAKELVSAEVMGAAILGPKIGNGFFSNLNGEFGQLTVDRWFMRTWGRWTGTLIETKPENLAKQVSRMKAAISSLSSKDKRAWSKLIGQPLTRTQPEALAQAIAKASIDPKAREAMNATEAGSELRKAGNAVNKYLDGQKEAPANGNEMKKIREVMTQALAQLQKEKGLKKLTMADLQAVLWYGEKRLYESAKAKEEDGSAGYNDDEAPDYANAAAKLVKANGVTQAQIDKALNNAGQTQNTSGRAGRNSAQVGAQAGQAGTETVSSGQAQTRGDEDAVVGVREDEVTYETSDVYERIETRSGTTPQQEATGRSAIRDLQRRLNSYIQRRREDTGTDGGTASVLGQRLLANFKAGEPNQLVGARIGSLDDVATLAQVYRNPKFETLRVIYMKGRTVVGESAFTSRMPGSVSFADGLPVDVIDSEMKRLNASGYMLLHNHPSGRSRPSTGDKRSTELIARTTMGFLGHVVIDFNEYSMIDSDGIAQTFDLDVDATDFTATPEIPHPLLGQSITSQVDLAQIGKQLAQPDNFVVVLVNSKGEVNQLTSLPRDFFSLGSGPRAQALLRGFMRESGTGSNAFLVLPETVTKQENLEARSFEIFKDIVHADGRTAKYYRGQNAGRRIMKRTAHRTPERLIGMPETVTVDGKEKPFSDFPVAKKAARDYMKKAGLPYSEPTVYAELDQDRAKRIAREFIAMEHAPNDPEVKASYDAMIKETLAQFEEVLNTGLTIRFIKGADPYGNPRNAILDVVENNNLFVFSTRDGFGSDETFDVSENPLLQETKFKTSDGEPMLANDVFRVVHDYFGHIKNGVGFRARGEENAWQSHAAMYSPLARRAMTTETRGQNSWVNFGPNAEANKTASGEDTVYADQKIGLLPIWVSEEGRLSDQLRRDRPEYLAGLEGAISDGRLQLSHYSNQEIGRTDPNRAGTGLDRKVSGRRYLPKATYFGITQADENGYRRESGLGPVESEFSIAPEQLYPLDTNPLKFKGSYPDLIEQMQANGFSGLWRDHPALGKVAVVWDPLDTGFDEEATAYTRSDAGLYSALERAIAEARIPGLTPSKRNPAGAIRASNWMQYLRNRPIKQEEWKWTGMRDLLTADPKRRYTRDELLEEMRARRVELGDVVAGSGAFDPTADMKREEPTRHEKLSRDEASIWADLLTEFDNEGAMRGLVREDLLTDFGDAQGLSVWGDGEQVIVGSANYDRYLVAKNIDGEIRPLGPAGGSPAFSFTEAKVQLREYLLDAGLETDAQWEEYVEVGSYSDYHELKVTLPGIEDTFLKSAHFPDRNIVGFVRGTMRDGGSRYFVEELQSDWHQTGRQLGYRGESTAKLQARVQELMGRMDGLYTNAAKQLAAADVDHIGVDEKTARKALEKWFQNKLSVASRRRGGQRRFSQPMPKIQAAGEWLLANPDLKHEFDRWIERVDYVASERERAPDAPFKNDAWMNLMVKRALLEAAQRGAETFSWIPSENMEIRWSDVYGELYRNTYDKKIPSLVRKLTGETPVKKGYDYWSVPLTQEVKDNVLSEGLPMFRANDQQRGSTVEQVEAFVAGMPEQMRDRMTVVQSIDDLPANMREEMNRQGVESISGLFERSSQRVWLVADGIKNKKAAQATLLHESIGHRGIEAVMGPQIREFLSMVENARGSDAVIDDAYQYVERMYSGAPPIVMASEVVARISESDPKHNVLQRVYQWFRQQLRKMGFDVAFTNGDIVEALRRAKGATPGQAPNTEGIIPSAPMFKVAEGYKPKKTVKAYKLFNYSDGKLYPLFVNDGEPVPIGKWMEARIGDDYSFQAPNGRWYVPAKTGTNIKLEGSPELAQELYERGYISKPTNKSIKAVARRPGWHAGDAPMSTHLGKWDPSMPIPEKRGSNVNYRPTEQVWAEVEMPDDFDWQSEANSRAGMTKAGKIKVGEAHITDEIPFEGYYRYKTNPQMTGNWLVSGHLKVNRIIPDSEVQQINEDMGTQDLPRRPGDDILFRAEEDNQFREGETNNFSMPEEQLVDRAVRKIQDKFARLKRLQEVIKESGGIVDESNDAYLAEERFHGKAENDLRLMREKFIEPLVKKMAEFGITHEQLDRYLYAMHAPERNRHIASINDDMPDGGSGMTDMEAGRILAAIRAEGKMDQMKELAVFVRGMLEAQREMIVSGGLEDDGTVAAWQDKYNHYVPLKGWAADTKQQGIPSTGKGFNIRGRESQRAMGRSTEAASPLSYTILDLTEKIVRKRKNEVGNTLLKLIEDNPNSDYWEVFTEDNPETTRKIVRKRDPETGEMVEKVEERTMNMWGSEDYFTTKRDGKTYFMKLKDPLLMRAMKNLGPESINSVLRGFANVNRFMSAVNTSYAPEFVISNFARDYQTALLNLSAENSLGEKGKSGEARVKANLKKVFGSMAAIHQSLRGKEADSKEGRELQKWYDEYRAAGAQTGYFDRKDIDGIAADISKMTAMAEGGFTGTAMQWGKAVGDFVENANQAVENAVRLAAYISAREGGLTVNQSATLAKNMTVNFNRRGEMGTLLNSLYMFANASTQGIANFARTMMTLKSKDDAKGLGRLNNAQRLAVALMAGSYMLAAANRYAAGEDDDGENFYDKVPGYVRERNLVLMKSMFGGEPGEYWKLPLPYGYNVFHVLGDGMESVVSGSKDPLKAAGDLTLAVLGSFSPIGFQDSNQGPLGIFAKNATPSPLKPVTDILMNENFMGSQIYNEGNPWGTPVPDSSLGRRSTPEAYKALSKWMNEASGGSEQRTGAVDVNPDIMAYVVDYFTGSAGSFVNKTLDAGVKTALGVEVENYQKPFIRRLEGKVLPYEDQSTFYERRDEIGQVMNELKAVRGEERKKFREEFGGLIKMAPKVKQTENRLKLLRTRRERIYENESLSASDRDKRLKEIEAQMETVIDEFNAAYVQAAE